MDIRLYVAICPSCKKQIPIISGSTPGEFHIAIHRFKDDKDKKIVCKGSDTIVEISAKNIKAKWQSV